MTKEAEIRINSLPNPEVDRPVGIGFHGTSTISLLRTLQSGYFVGARGKYYEPSAVAGPKRYRDGDLFIEVTPEYFTELLKDRLFCKMLVDQMNEVLRHDRQFDASNLAGLAEEFSPFEDASYYASRNQLFHALMQFTSIGMKPDREKKLVEIESEWMFNHFGDFDYLVKLLKWNEIKIFDRPSLEKYFAMRGVVLTIDTSHLTEVQVIPGDGADDVALRHPSGRLPSSIIKTIQPQSEAATAEIGKAIGKL